MSARVAVLVPHHNRIELLKNLIPSLIAQTFRDRVLVLIDDASTDDSAAEAARLWPELKIIRSEVNQGFAATVNLGIESSQSEFVAIVNSDVELAPDWLALLVATLEQHPGAGSATGKTLIAGDHTRLDGAGNQMRWSGAAGQRGYGQLDQGQFDAAANVISACAGYSMYRRSALDHVGLFDEDLLAYYEDVDWGLRAQLAGYGCRYQPGAIATHVGSATHGRSKRYLRLERRNMLLVVVKCYPLSAIVLALPQIILYQGVLICRGALNGTMAVQLFAILDAIRATPRFLRKRSAVRRLRTVSRKQLNAVMTPQRLPWLSAR
jgi:GT2 family glycosyltransferase